MRTFKYVFLSLISGELKMPLIDVFSITEPQGIIPSRFYVHSTGFLEVFSRDARVSRDVAEEYALETIRFVSGMPFTLRNVDYMLGVVWGDISSGEKVVDIFSYSDIKDWPGNPDVNLFVIRNGKVSSPLETCGDSLIMLGREEEYRRNCKDLKEYMSTPPKGIILG